LVLSRSPLSIASLEVKTANARRGEMLEIVLSDGGVLPDGMFRLVHLDVKTPEGEVYEAYSRNAVVRATPHVERIPLAVNDPAGKWTVRAHDLMSAQVVEVGFELA
jgi:hypothetical protein